MTIILMCIAFVLFCSLWDEAESPPTNWPRVFILMLSITICILIACLFDRP